MRTNATMRIRASMLRAWLAIALVYASPAFAQAPPGSAERGAKLYVEKMCYTCHGYSGQGGERGSGPRVAPDVWPWEAFERQTRRPRADMPRYPQQFVSDQELADIHAWLLTIKPGPKAADIPLLRGN
jgi:mono/diheme cytochrome c family protein